MPLPISEELPSIRPSRPSGSQELTYLGRTMITEPFPNDTIARLVGTILADKQSFSAIHETMRPSSATPLAFGALPPEKRLFTLVRVRENIHALAQKWELPLEQLQSLDEYKTHFSGIKETVHKFGDMTIKFVQQGAMKVAKVISKKGAPNFPSSREKMKEHILETVRKAPTGERVSDEEFEDLSQAMEEGNFEHMTEEQAEQEDDLLQRTIEDMLGEKFSETHEIERKRSVPAEKKGEEILAKEKTHSSFPLREPMKAKEAKKEKDFEAVVKLLVEGMSINHLFEESRKEERKQAKKEEEAKERKAEAIREDVKKHEKALAITALDAFKHTLKTLCDHLVGPPIPAA